jgi:hypothetical protein
MSATKQDNNSESQAKAQLESIKEMLAGLERSDAAKLFVKGLESENVAKLLLEAGTTGIDSYESLDDAKAVVAEAIEDETIDDPDGFEFDEEAAREAIEEDPLSVEVRSDWYTPGSENREPGEYCILLCTGGPAVRIVGDLDNGEPSSARIEHQDWFTPWQELIVNSNDRAALLRYARCFYYGE